MRSTVSATRYLELRPVVIVGNGTIQPGYVQWFDHEYIAYKIDMTVSGEGRHALGKTKALSFPIRIIDANDFLISEIFKQYFKPDKVEAVVQQILSGTAERYQIPIVSLEFKIENAFATSKTKEWASAPISDTLFSFGTEENIKTRVRRITIDNF